MKKLRFTIAAVAFVALALFPQPGQAVSLGIEADIMPTVLNAVSATEDNRANVALRLYLGDYFHLGVDVSDERPDKGPSTIQLVAPIPSYGPYFIDDRYYGASVGFYLSGYNQSSFRVIATGGQANRRFEVGQIGVSDSKGSFYMGEVGYQFVLNTGILSLGYVYRVSDLETSKEFTQGASRWVYEEDKQHAFLKLGVGFIF